MSVAVLAVGVKADLESEGEENPESETKVAGGKKQALEAEDEAEDADDDVEDADDDGGGGGGGVSLSMAAAACRAATLETMEEIKGGRVKR